MTKLKVLEIIFEGVTATLATAGFIAAMMSVAMLSQSNLPF